MTSDEIRFALFKKKVSMASIGKGLNPKVTRQMVSRVVARDPKFPSYRVKKAIATALGHDLIYVWPELIGKNRPDRVSNNT